jgi:AraC-like DNA-binding protein
MAATLFHDTVFNAIQDILANVSERDSGSREKPSRRFRTAQAARAYISVSSGTEITTRMVSEELGITSRELRYAFQEAYGVSPYQYVIFDKLSRPADSFENPATSPEACRVRRRASA